MTSRYLKEITIKGLVISALFINSAAYVFSAPPVTSAPPAKVAPAPKLAAKMWSRHLFGKKVRKGLKSAPPPVSAAPGLPESWQAAFPVYGGVQNLSTGNLTLTHKLASWTSLGSSISLDLVFNSQASTTTSVGPKWRHSYLSTAVASGGNVVVTHPDGLTVTYTGSGGGFTSPAGHFEVLTSDPGGGYTLTYRDGSQRVFSSGGNLSQIIDPFGNTVSIAYASGRVSTVTDGAGRALTFGYDTSGKLTTATDFEGRVWTLTYDTAGRLTGVAEPVLNGQTYSTTFAYNSGGNVSAVTNRLGKTWQYFYNGDIFSYQTTPAGTSSGTVQESNPSHDQNQFSSDEDSEAIPDNTSTTYPVGTVATAYVEDDSGRAREYGLDSTGRITAERDGTGAQTNYSYNANNQRVQVIEPGTATTANTYDTAGNLLTTTDPSGRTTTYTYDSNNNLLTTTDHAGNTVTNTYSGHALTSTTDATNNTTTYVVNGNGYVTSETDPAGKTTTYQYNLYGDNTHITDPLGNTTVYTYNNGRVATRTDARGRTTSYSYDGWGRLTGIDYPTSTDQSFQYDAEGKLTQAVDGTGTRTFTYDDLGRKTYQTDPRGNTSATYDAAGRVLTQTDVTGRLISYTYDGNGRLAQVSDSSSWAQYQYNARGQQTKATFSNGVYTDYGYDSAGRVTSIYHRRSPYNLISSTTATYDAAGRLSTVTEGPTSATTTYTYDNAGRLLTENRTGDSPYTSTYTYNSRGLRATAYRAENGVASHNGTYSYDNSGRLTSITDTVTTSGLGGNYTWNNDGTLASYPGPGYRRILDYDEEGRLTSISQQVGSGTPTVKFQYGYGYDGGRRWRKDLASGIWDWYPCGVACCAGDLVTLRSTNGGTTWSTNETRLAGAAPARVGSDFYLGPLGGGKSRMASSTTVTATVLRDGLGVVRSGSLSGGLNSLLQAYRGDEGYDQLFAQAQIQQVFQKQVAQKQKQKQVQKALSRSECLEIFKDKKEDCRSKLTNCLAGFGIGATVLLACTASCAFPEPLFSKAICIACLVGAGVVGGGGAYKCFQDNSACSKDADAWLQRCLAKAPK